MTHIIAGTPSLPRECRPRPRTFHELSRHTPVDGVETPGAKPLLVTLFTTTRLLIYLLERNMPPSAYSLSFRVAITYIAVNQCNVPTEVSHAYDAESIHSGRGR
jgi:hypothetical protein